MKRYLPFAIIALVAATTLGAGTWFYRTTQARVAAAAEKVSATAPGAKAGAKLAHIRGEAKAQLTIEEFADFQCPPCAALSGIMHQLEEEYRGRLRIVFRHFPLRNHQHARPAALAAEAAAFQGKFWEMHDLLYKNQTEWSKAAEIRPVLIGYAASLGLDPTKFNADMDDPRTAARITADQERAASLGVKQTPTVFLNNQFIPVPQLSANGLRAAIDGALKSKPTP